MNSFFFFSWPTLKLLFSLLLLCQALDPEPSDRYVQAPQLKRTDSEASLSSTTSSLGIIVDIYRIEL